MTSENDQNENEFTHDDIDYIAVEVAREEDENNCLLGGCAFANNCSPNHAPPCAAELRVDAREIVWKKRKPDCPVVKTPPEESCRSFG